MESCAVHFKIEVAVISLSEIEQPSCSYRVIRLGEFSPIGRLFFGGQFL
jgi:hypothetical protein